MLYYEEEDDITSFWNNADALLRPIEKHQYPISQSVSKFCQSVFEIKLTSLQKPITFCANLGKDQPPSSLV